jgi:cell division protein FtsZ
MKSIIQNAIKHAKEERASTIREPGKAVIIVCGVGGGGNNTVKRMMHLGIQGAECIAVNTDKQHLDSVPAHRKILIGEKTTRGLGAGGDPELGAAAAEESRLIISQALEGADMVFVTCGLGGGTGTGGAPIVAEIAKEVGAIVIGVVTLPFKVEGELRNARAREGLSKLREHVDTVVVVDNNKLLEVAPDYPIEEAFAVADEVLATMVKGITETIKLPSLINLDFADIKSIMGVGGVAIIGIGEAEGENRAERSVEEALNNPLLSLVVTGATGALVHVSGGADMTLSEATRVAELVTRRMVPNSKVIWGARVSPNLNGIIRTILLLTGIKGDSVLGPDADIMGFEAGFHELAEMRELGVDVQENVIETTGRIEAMKRQDARATEFNLSRSAFSQQKKRSEDVDFGLQRL